MTDKVIVYHIKPVPTHGEARVFSKELHGAGYKEIAAQYAATNAHNVAKIDGLEKEEVQTARKKLKKS